MRGDDAPPTSIVMRGLDPRLSGLTTMMFGSCPASGVAPPTTVIAGLDPAIQASAGALSDRMDARVKPAHDKEVARLPWPFNRACRTDSTRLDPRIIGSGRAAGLWRTSRLNVRLALQPAREPFNRSGLDRI
jgi:hypothetical protein